eukprot:g6959.t1
MRYIASPVLLPVLKYAEPAEPVIKTAPPTASVGLRIQHSSVDKSPQFDFQFIPELELRHPSKKRRWRQFLSLGFLGREDDRQTLKTFREIDSRNRGEFTKDDLSRYAIKNGIPMDYVDAFMTQLNGERESPIGFKTFRNFVTSKEDALRRAFGIFDSDGDGRINASDLESSLSHVRVCCPTSSCVYKCRKQCIQQLVEKVDLNRDNVIDFGEFRKFFMLLPQNNSLVDYWLSANCSERCDLGGCVVIHDGDRYRKQGSSTNPWGHLFAGAFAGAASRTATAPLETLRLSAMTGSIPKDMSSIQAARTVCKADGWRSLFKGNLTNVIRAAPQKALDFFAFDAFKRLLGNDTTDGGYSPWKTIAAGGLAGATSNLALYPLEVVRSRLTIDSTGAYKGVLHAFGKIHRQEGLAGLYRGVGPSVLGIVPEAAIVYGLFDLSKRAYKKVKGEEPGVIASLSFGVFSAFMGQVVAYPLETVSRRMQVHEMGSQINFGLCLNEIITKEGMGGLYRGLGAASARVIPMAIVSFGTYELVSRLVKEVEEMYDRAKAEEEIRKSQNHTCNSLLLKQSQ